MIGKAYRYQDTLYSSGSEETGFHAYVRVNLLIYDVVKTTPKGMWIRAFPGASSRFVRLNAKKKYACLTKEEALISFKKRKERQIKLLETKVRLAKDALILSKKYEEVSNEG